MARESGEWQKIRAKKQQPVGLSEEQLQFTFAVAKGQILAKTKGQFPAPLAALDVRSRLGRLRKKLKIMLLNRLRHEKHV